MSKPSGTSDAILSLPSGGGSVSGSGTSFSVDLNTGTASAGFELMIPAGPNGIKPPLQLTYSASSGDGAFGLGWSLGLLTVVQKLTPSADAPDPTVPGFYTLVGVGDLVAMGSGRFRPDVDTTSALMEFANGSWTITDTSDTVCTLGKTTNSQMGGSSPGAWLLDTYTDSSGNAILYTWLEDGGARYPNMVTWGSYQVIFVYEARPDIVLNGQFGAPIKFAKRCSQIELHVSTETQTLVRSWTLLYDDNGGRGRSQLVTIREQGHAADGSVLQAPDRSYGYTQMGKPSFQPVTGWTTSLLDGDTDFVDLNGDGLPDVLHTAPGGPTMHPNLGAGQFGYPRVFARAPAYLQLSSPGVAFADMSGEGNVDLLVINEKLTGYYPLSVPQAGSEPSTFGFPVVFENAPPFQPADPRVRMLDLNGDGITDMLVDTGGAWMMYLREDTATWSRTPRLLASDRTPPVELTDQHIYLADITGDGLMDIIRVDGGSIQFWPARADGGWDAAIPMLPSPAFNRNYDPSRMNVVDIDGDGCADFVYVDANAVTVWRNVGAGQLSDAIVVSRTPFAQVGSYRLLDLLGGGTAGVLFEMPPLQMGMSRQTFLDLSGGSKPYLLSQYDNGPAMTTAITYRASTGFAQDDAANGNPWQTYHPFPVQCVARTDHTDNATGITSTTQYVYHDGRYDPGTRTFLGFSKVESQQSGDASCPTLSMVTTFHVGVDPADPTRPLYGDEALTMRALRRRVLSTSAYSLDGSALEAAPYSVTTHTYKAVLVPSTLDADNKVAVPYLSTTTEERWERAAAPVSTRMIEYLTIDAWGSITSQRTRATRAGMAAPDQDVTTTMTFATGGTNLHLQARTTQTGPDGSVISSAVIYYDGAAFEGLPEGQATQGLVSRVEVLALTDALLDAAWTTPPDLTAYGYHRQAGDTTGWWITQRAHERITGANGPALLTKGPLGGVNKLQLDPTSQFLTAVTDEAGNTITATFNSRVWQIASITDANGNVSSDEFDALGRVTASIGPHDTPALPKGTFSYTSGAISEVVGSARVVHGGTDLMTTKTWIGGAGQILGKVTPAATAGQWIVTGATLNNIRGLPVTAYLPYETASATWETPATDNPVSTYIYDGLGRIVQFTRPDGLTVLTRRDGSTIIVSEMWPGQAATDIEMQVVDAAGQVISVSRNAGDHWVEQRYTYDPGGKLATATLPGGAVVTSVSDLLGRRLSQQSPDSGLTAILVDAAGNERLYRNASGQQVQREFDLAGRATAIYHDSETTPRVQFAYLDQGATTPPDGITANRTGRLWQITDELGTVTRQYDENGNVVSNLRTVAATGQTFPIETSYDAIGRVVALTSPSDANGTTPVAVTYEYGLDGRLASSPGFVTSAAFDVYGRMTTLVSANGTTTVNTYRPAGGGLERVVVTDSTGAVIRDTTASWSQAMVSGLKSAVAEDDSVSFSYDGMRRLAGADYTQGTSALDAHTWTFDDTYAMTGASGTAALTYKAGTHQLASVGGQAVAFDAAGRMSVGRFGTPQFDSENRLTGITTTDGTSIAHGYDYAGRRAQTTTAGVQTYFSPIAGLEVQGGSSVLWIYFGQLKVAASSAGSVWFLHGNALGGVDLVTDSAGHNATRLRQTPFLAARPPTGPAATGIPAELSFLLIGADASGMICQGRRWYDPSVGQFLSPDPIVTSVYMIGAWNPYAYCLNNPIALCDPSGMSFFSVLVGIGTALVIAALVVAAFYTAGTSLIGAAALASTEGTFTMVGVAIGSFGGALAGESAAQRAGGNIVLGALVGAIVGGLSSLVGGVIAPVGSTAAATFSDYVASGLAQGTFAGLGTGAAVGFAGGKGSVESIVLGMAQGAAWGAFLGSVLGAGVGLTETVGAPANYLSIDFGSKFNQTTTIADSINSADNVANVWQTFQSLAWKNGFTASNFAGFIPDVISTTPAASGEVINGVILSVSIKWLPAAVLQYGGFAVAVNLSMAADQAGFSYAAQLATFIGIAPFFIDFAVAEFQILDPNDSNTAENWFNSKFGSAEAG